MVKDPKWAGTAGETAVVVSRGDPRRSDEQMREIVGDQVERYLVQYGDREYVAAVIDLVVESIASNYIYPEGSQGVVLTREHLFAFVEAEIKRLNTRDTAVVKLTAPPVRFTRVGPAAVMAKFLEGQLAVNSSPEAQKLAAMLAQENVRSVMQILHVLGFVIAQPATLERPVGAVGEVISIFAAGKHHAPQRMAVLKESWPALHEALDGLLDELHQEDRNGD